MKDRSPPHRQRFSALRRLLSRPRGIPFRQQTTSADCGAACLVMALEYFGKQVALEEARVVAGVGRGGSNAHSLLQAGRWFGLRGRAVKVADLKDVAYLPKASILHWRFHHFVVFEKRQGRRFLILDPAKGRLSVSRDEFSRSFTGVALIFEPGEFFEPGKRNKKGFRRYLDRLRSESSVLTRVLTASLLLQGLALALPILMGILVDRILPRQDVDLLLIMAGGLAVVVLFRFLCLMLRSHLLIYLRTRLDARLTLDFIDHLTNLPYLFFQQRSTGDLIMRASSNALIREILTSSALSAILDGFLVTLYLLLIFLTHAQMGLLVLLLGLLRTGVFLVAHRRYRDLTSERLQAQANSQGHQVQMLAGIETLKASGSEDRAVERWSHYLVDELNVTATVGRLSAKVDSLLETLAAASPLVVLMVGAHLVLTQQLSLGALLALNALAVGFLEPLSKLISTAFDLQRMSGHLERIDDVMDHPREQDRSQVTAPGSLSGKISVQNVSFRYSPLAPLVVQEASFEVEPGQFMALVGRSGSGKSTLAGLLLGLYRAETGQILYDGMDLRRLDLQAVRRQIGMVTQQPHLFPGTIRDNIGGNSSAPLPRVIEAARMACIHEDVSAMPLAYNTSLADNGASLSGGQRQRLALARALFHFPRIVVLDEATSALDAVTERAVHENLRRLSATRIVIAHRVTTIQDADLILVLEDGRIAERGDHSELSRRGGLYAQLTGAARESRPASGSSERVQTDPPHPLKTAPQFGKKE